MIPDLLARRIAAREQALAKHLDKARNAAALHGLTLTCQEKPRDQHYTCIGLSPGSYKGQPMNDGLGCLCECHDPVTETPVAR